MSAKYWWLAPYGWIIPFAMGACFSGVVMALGALAMRLRATTKDKK